jgi:hypothetical protein
MWRSSGHFEAVAEERCPYNNVMILPGSIFMWDIAMYSEIEGVGEL